MKKFSIALLVALVAMLAASSYAGAPSIINYQGQLTNALGNPVTDSTYSVTFTIYDAPSGGTNLWSETLNLTTSAGLISVQLGAIVPFTGTLFDDTSRYLGIQVNPDAEMSPRMRLGSVPYTLRDYSAVSGGPGPDSLPAGWTPAIDCSGGNSSAGAFSGIFVGDGNRIINAPYSFIGGGSCNTCDGGIHTTIAGGHSNTAEANLSTIGGGNRNTALVTAIAGTIAGGDGNFIYNDYTTIGGGYSNQAIGQYCTVGGGNTNQTGPGKECTVGGGKFNFAGSLGSTIGGGDSNTVSGNFGAICGGKYNEATGLLSTIGGGGSLVIFTGNQATGDYSTIGGGESHIASGVAATVPGGQLNSALGDYSFAAGRRARAINDGSFVWADQTNVDFPSVLDNQFRVRANGGVNIVGAPTTTPVAHLRVDGSVSIFNSLLIGGNPDGNTSLFFGQESVGSPSTTLGEWGIQYWPPSLGGGGLNFWKPSGSSGSGFGNNILFLSDNHNVGIGTSTPGATTNTRFDVVGRVSFRPITGNTNKFLIFDDISGALRIYSDASGTPGDLILGTYPNGHVDQLVLKQSNGFVGVGISSPTEKLDVVGTARLRGMGSGTGTDVVVDGTGVLLKKSSSRRYKTNIRELNVNAEKVFGLNPVRFQWKSTGKEDIGLIAEEVAEVISDLVIYDNEGRPEAVKYDRVGIYLLDVVKEQQKQIDELKNIVDKLVSATLTNVTLSKK